VDGLPLVSAELKAFLRKLVEKSAHSRPGERGRACLDRRLGESALGAEVSVSGVPRTGWWLVCRAAVGEGQLDG
jgi:hypothetical protein